MSGKKTRGRNLASDISLLADFYEKADKKRRLDTDRMWKRVEAGKDKLPCEHGRFMNDPRLRVLLGTGSWSCLLRPLQGLPRVGHP
jgi:hypothetical protein